MNFQVFFKKGIAIILGALCILPSIAGAQTRTRPTPTLIIEAAKPMAVAERNNLYCAGYVQTSPIDKSNKLVRAAEEQEQFFYAENDVVYVNMGANKGVNVGDMMSVVRPRGRVNTRWTKKSSLGFYVQEVGALEVIRVKAGVSVARVKTSCDNLLLGDLVLPVPARTSPIFQTRAALDLYADPTGKALGRLFMARDNHELLGRDQIVYIDLGAEDNVRIGDYLTIFRPLGKGNLNISIAKESSEYRSGIFSNQAGRKSGSTAQGSVVTTSRAKHDRPDRLRKIVGEMVILNVKERTATAMITRNAQEIHTGDWVEVQ